MIHVPISLPGEDSYPVPTVTSKLPEGTDSC